MSEFTEFAEALFSALGIPTVGSLDPQLGLFTDIGLDSIQAFEMVLVIEEMAGVVLPPAELPEIYTLSDAYNYFRMARDHPGE